MLCEFEGKHDCARVKFFRQAAHVFLAAADRRSMLTVLELPLSAAHTSQNLPDRRNGLSPLEEASNTLQHAVAYLVDLNRNGGRNVHTNRQAIALLCEALRDVAECERRAAPREHARSWLQRLMAGYAR